MGVNRRQWLGLVSLAAWGGQGDWARASDRERVEPLRITDLKVTPIALPDPPLLAASGCHGPYFLRNVVEVHAEGGIVGIGETVGGARTRDALKRAATLVKGRSVFAHRTLEPVLKGLGMGCLAGVELACLDACGQATSRRVCDLVGGPTRQTVEFAAYLFYRYAADHPVVLADPRRVDARGSGAFALDDWGEIRDPKTMAASALRMKREFGFRVFKLKAGVLTPDRELESMVALASALGPEACLRIDPNARWKTATAIRIGKQLAKLPLEYYEDPVAGRSAMAEVRRATGLKTSTNMCVTAFEHIPDALKLHPIDVLLCDHHYFGGFAGCQALGPISRAAGWGLSQHSNSHAGITMAAMIHLAASIPELQYASDTHYPWLPPTADIIEGGKLPIQNGRMTVPDGPGLGVRLDRDRLARAHETYEKCGMKDRDDRSLMQRLEPGWTGELM